MRLAALSLLLCAATARAQGMPVTLGDPCAPGYDVNAQAVVETATLPDGGVEDVPAAICAGQRAPVHGVFLTVKQAAALTGERASKDAENASLQHALARQTDAATAAVAGLASGALTVFVTVWCSTHDCNPLHAGKK